jgi:cytochrome c-type biogenesis protein CcmH
VSRSFVVAAIVGLSLLVHPGVGASAVEPPRASDLEAEVVCPTCKTTLDQSDAPVARRMKAIIRERIAAGATGDEIKQELVEQFGPAVLAEPPKQGFDLLAWALPLAFVAAGAVVVGVLAWTWSRRHGDDDDALVAPLDPVLERRIDDELARLEE